MFTCDVSKRALLHALRWLRDLSKKKKKKKSHDDVSYRINGENVNAMLEYTIRRDVMIK